MKALIGKGVYFNFESGYAQNKSVQKTNNEHHGTYQDVTEKENNNLSRFYILVITVFNLHLITIEPHYQLIPLLQQLR